MERQNGTTRHTNGRLRRLCYAFSKRPENHRAAIALNYVGYNLCHVVRTLRVTPAMQANVTDHVWSVEELLRALLDAQPVERPRAPPLAPQACEGPARQTATGRLLRLEDQGRNPIFRFKVGRDWIGEYQIDDADSLEALMKKLEDAVVHRAIEALG
jgi:hypothetical protein